MHKKIDRNCTKLFMQDSKSKFMIYIFFKFFVGKRKIKDKYVCVCQNLKDNFLEVE